MRTRIGIFCDRLLEAAWLLAVILVPLHYNIYTNRTFEPDKLSLLRSLVIIICCVWIVKFLEGRLRGNGPAATGEASPQTGNGRWWTFLTQTPLVLPVVLFFFAYLLSVVFSIVPALSVWGSYSRLQGLYSMFSYIVVFVTILATLREKEQLDRLLNAIILTSVPVALYGVLQHYGVDPTGWSMNMRDRPGANMGNPIFLAAYLIMVMPLTLWRVIEFFPGQANRTKNQSFSTILFSCYLFASICQLAAVFFSQSRGPWLGMFGGLSVFTLLGLLLLRRMEGFDHPFTLRDGARALLFSILSTITLFIPAYAVAIFRRKGFRWLWLAFVFQIIFLLGFIALLNIPKSPLAALRDAPYIGRLGHLSEAESGTAKVRAIIWRGAVELIGSNPLRMIIGYGPESMKYVWDPHSPRELAHYEARNASPDRSHNEAFDLLVTTGLIGFLVYMFLISSIIYYSMKWLGLIEKKGRAALLVGLCAAGAVAGGFLPRWVEGSYAFAGVGIPCGLLIGFFIYLIINPAFIKPVRNGSSGLTRCLLLLGLFSGIVAHFVEIQTGIAIASTRLHFFVFAALLVLTGLNRIGEGETGANGPLPGEIPGEPGQGAAVRQSSKKQKKKVPPPGAHSKNEPGLPQPIRVLAWSIITATILFTIGFGFVMNTQGETDPVAILSSSLLSVTVGGETTTSFGVILLLFATFAVGLVFAMEPVLRSEVTAAGAPSGGERKIRLLEAGGIYASICFFVFLISIVIQASIITPDHDISMTIVYYYLVISISLLAIAFALPRTSPSGVHFAKPYAYWLYPIILLAGLWAVASLNLRIVRADIYLKAALAFEQRQQWDGSIRFYERAIGLAPNEDFYCLSYGRALFGKAASLPPGKEKDAIYTKIYEVMSRAHLINPLNTDHLANLGLLYIRWAESDPSAEGRAQKLKKAHMYYELAAKGSPRKTIIMNNWSKVYAAEGNYEGAIAKLKHSLTLDDKIGATYFTLADIYGAMGRTDDAVLSYRKGTEIEPGNAEAVATLAHLYYRQGRIKEATDTSLKALSIDPRLIKAHSLLGLIYYKSGRLPQAISENLEIVKVNPGNIQAHRNLAIIYEQSGQMGNAIKHMEKVIALSPESERPRLVQALEQMKARMGSMPARNP